MHWITENPWPLVILLCGTAACVLLLAEKSRLLISSCLVLSAVGFWYIESVIVTPGEEVEVELQQMLECFIAKDIDGIRARISPAAPDLATTAESGLKLVTLHSTFHLKDIQVESDETGETVIATLRANGRATLKRNNMSSHVTTRWRTTWKREGADWKLVKVRRLDIVSGREIDALSPG